jgi:hypothetical protein
MKAWPVSPRVNSPKNNDPEIIVPIEPESVARQANLCNCCEVNFGTNPAANKYFNVNQAHD